MLAIAGHRECDRAGGCEDQPEAEAEGEIAAVDAVELADTVALSTVFVCGWNPSGLSRMMTCWSPCSCGWKPSGCGTPCSIVWYARPRFAGVTPALSSLTTGRAEDAGAPREICDVVVAVRNASHAAAAGHALLGPAVADDAGAEDPALRADLRRIVDVRAAGTLPPLATLALNGPRSSAVAPQLRYGVSTCCAANGPRSDDVAPQLRYEISLGLLLAASLRIWADAVVVKIAAVATPRASALRLSLNSFGCYACFRSSLGVLRMARGSAAR